MNKQLISMFNVALKGDKTNFAKVNAESMKAGYFIHPDCCTREALAWAISQKVNFNSTFYKTWNEITTKSRFELFADQIIHYCTTYGTDFSIGNGYVPNDNPIVIPFEKFKVIMPVSEEEVFEKIMNMFKSGIALKPETINIFVEYFEDYNFLDKVNLDEIKNKETQAIISNKIGKLPSDEFGMLRAIVYGYTGSAMLIKDKKTISIIKQKNPFGKGIFDFSTLTNEQLKKLSRIFYRYKPLFLAMKNKRDAAAINKIRKLAKVHHKPLVKGFWEICLTKQGDLKTAEEKVGELNNFRKIQLMQSIKERLLSKDDKGKMFVIRNGSIWVEENYKSNDDINYLISLYKILEKSLTDSISAKACKIRLPKSLKLVCPTSEKNFIGNIPMGSYIPMENKHNMFGIYWRNEWGARDLDLWYTDMDGNRFGWCGSYYDEENDIIFSGDMTNASPEATEIFYFSQNCHDGNIGVNIYSAHHNKPKFRLFVANENENGKFENRRRETDAYMVDPNNVLFSTEIEFDNSYGLKKIGIIHNNKIFFVDFGAGAGRVSSEKAADIINRQMIKKVESCVGLRNILHKAGFTILEDDDIIDSENEDIILDFTNPSKDDLIDLFM